MAWEEDFNGNKTEYTYNAFNQATQVKDARGEPTDFVYDNHGNLTHIADASQEETINSYDPTTGYLMSVRDPLLNETDFTYNAMGLVETQTDAEENVTTYGYDVRGNRTSETRTRTRLDDVAETLLSESGYDAMGRVTSETVTSVVDSVETVLQETSTTYNALGKQATFTTVNGTTSYTYDERGYLARVDYPDESYETFEYDGEGNRIASRNRDGHVTTSEYDKLGRLSKTFAPDDPNTVISETQYDAIGRVTDQINDRGVTRKTNYGEPQDGHTFVTVENVDDVPDYGSTTSEYDSNGNLVKFTDGKGKTTEHVYDEMNRLDHTIYPGTTATTSYEYDAAGRRAAVTDQANHRTQYRYDKVGRLTKVIDAKLRETTYDYDEFGNLIEQTDANQHATEMEYDVLGRLVERRTPEGDRETLDYDDAGNLWKRFTPNEWAEHDADPLYEPQPILFDYDVNNRLQLKTLPVARFSTVLRNATPGMSENGVATFELNSDLSTLKIAWTHTIPGTETTAVDVVDADGTTVIQSLATGQTEPTGEATWALATGDVDAILAAQYSIRVSWGTSSEISGQIIGVSPQTAFAHTNAGLRTQNGLETLEHDARGRVTWDHLKWNPDDPGYDIEYVRDDDANTMTLNVYKVGDSTPSTSNIHTYDKLDRLESVSDDGGSTATSYTYDRNGNLETVSYPNGTSTTYGYNDLNRLTSVTNKKGSTTFSSYVYTLAPNGNRELVTEEALNWDGTPLPTRVVDYEYDELDRLTSETVLVDNVVQRIVDYTYDYVGNRKTMRVRTASTNDLYTFDYNDNDQLTQIDKENQFVAAANQEGPFRYASALPRPSIWSGRLLAGLGFAGLALLAAPLGLMRSASGRPLGRRARRRRMVNLSIILFMSLLMLVGPENVYALNAEAMLYHALPPAALGAVTTEATFSYDANGNMIAETRDIATTLHTYDAENRLIRTVKPTLGGRREITYQYDADGIRIARTTVDVDASGATAPDTIWYVVDKQRDYAQIIEERTPSGTLLAQYTHGLDLISQTRGSATSYYHYDGQMSTRQLTNGTGESTDRYAYDAFGELTDSGSSGDLTANNYLYTGEQQDADTGLYYLRARYYQPTTGRFTGRDSFGGSSSDPASLHKYLYCHADPINNLDPSGRFTLPQMVGYGAIVGGLIGAVYGGYRGAKESGKVLSWTTLEYAGIGLFAGVGIGMAAGAGLYFAGVGLTALGNAAGRTSILYDLIVHAHKTRLPVFGAGMVCGLLLGVTDLPAATAAVTGGMDAGAAAIFVLNQVARNVLKPKGVLDLYFRTLADPNNPRSTPFHDVRSIAFWATWFMAGFTVGFAVSKTIRWGTDELISYIDSAEATYGEGMRKEIDGTGPAVPDPGALM